VALKIKEGENSTNIAVEVLIRQNATMPQLKKKSMQL